MRVSFITAVLLAAAACSVVRSAALQEPDPGALAYLGGVEIPRDGRIGGLSGLAVTPDGTSFTAVSDEGAFVTGRLLHDTAGHLTGVGDLVRRKLGGIDPRNKQEADAEALARTPDGGWLVSFERNHRILAYPADLGAAPRRAPAPAGMQGLPANEGVEALTVLPDGSILALAEAQQNDDGLHLGWVGGERGWRAFRYRSDPLYAPTDAAVLPNGDVLVVERHFSMLLGLKVRLVMVTAEQLRSDPVIEAFALGDVAPPIGSDNFEGVSIRRASDGTVHVYLLSDDNFSALQRTLLVQYALRMAPKPIAHRQ